MLRVIQANFVNSADKPVVFTKPDSHIVRTSKLVFYLCMALVSPFAAFAFLCVLGGIALSVCGIAFLVKELPIVAIALGVAFLIGSGAFAISGRRRLKVLMHRINFLEAELGQAHGQVRELEQIISFDKQLKTEQRFKDKK
jgi:hypothetical protein